MKSVYSLKSICQECNKTHISNNYVVTSVNIDADTEYAKELFDFKLNLVKCPFCQTEYIFETGMVIYSPSNKFAVKVNPENNFANRHDCYPIPDFLYPGDFKFREVSFQIEAIEKCNIFLNGLDDVFVEYIKYKSFDDKDTMPFDEVNMIYTSHDKDFYYFTKYNYNNDKLGEFHIPTNSFGFENILTNPSNENSWKIINRQTINQYITDKER